MKICPKCNIPHDKKGSHCSRMCANSRFWSIEDKIKKSIAARNSVKNHIAQAQRRGVGYKPKKITHKISVIKALQPIKICIICNNNFTIKHDSCPDQFCSYICQRQHFKNIRKQQFAQGLLYQRRFIYDLLKDRDGNECSICGITEWQQKSIRLWVDHVDGNATNNLPENFRLICPNCESQTDTSRGKNYGKGRKSRGLACYD